MAETNPMNNYLGATKIMAPEIKVPVINNEKLEPKKRTKRRTKRRKSMKKPMKKKTRQSNKSKKHHMNHENKKLLEEMNNRLMNIEKVLQELSSRPIEVKVENKNLDEYHDKLNEQENKLNEHKMMNEDLLNEYDERLNQHEMKLNKLDNMKHSNHDHSPNKIMEDLIKHGEKPKKCMKKQNMIDHDMPNALPKALPHSLPKALPHSLPKALSMDPHNDVEHDENEQKEGENKTDINQLMKIINDLDKEPNKKPNMPLNLMTL